MSENYKLVLGLEIHLHLKTKTKMFCGCSADFYDKEANTHTCPVCLGLPGALPVANYEAVRKTQLLGLALGCKLNTNSKFDRKHYFYPDLPKGYQISQYKEPLCEGGSLQLTSGVFCEIERIHLEEDTAKSMHEGEHTLIDFNKSGMPLVEIVTKPTFKSVEDAVEFCKKIQDLVRLLEIGDVDMEKGQMRLEANISVRTQEMETSNILPKYKVEVKNINSFRFMEKAVRYEFKRQSELLSNSEKVVQENRGWDESLGQTVSQREKEEAHDYRYFPEPDLPPMVFSDEYLKKLSSELPELPWVKKARLIKQYGLSDSVALLLSSTDNKVILEKFESIVKAGIDPSKVANLLLNKLEYRELSTSDFVSKYKSENSKLTDTILISEAVDRVLTSNLKSIQEYRKGKLSVIEFLVGMAMRELKGKADANVVRGLISEKLNL